jgi:hypothetical protein
VFAAKFPWDFAAASIGSHTRSARDCWERRWVPLLWQLGLRLIGGGVCCCCRAHSVCWQRSLLGTWTAMAPSAKASSVPSVRCDSILPGRQVCHRLNHSTADSMGGLCQCVSWWQTIDRLASPAALHGTCQELNSTHCICLQFLPTLSICLAFREALVPVGIPRVCCCHSLQYWLTSHHACRVP